MSFLIAQFDFLLVFLAELCTTLLLFPIVFLFSYQYYCLKYSVLSVLISSTHPLVLSQSHISAKETLMEKCNLKCTYAHCFFLKMWHAKEVPKWKCRLWLNTNITFIFYKTAAELSILYCYEPQSFYSIHLMRILCLNLKRVFRKTIFSQCNCNVIK